MNLVPGKWQGRGLADLCFIVGTACSQQVGAILMQAGSGQGLVVETFPWLFLLGSKDSRGFNRMG